MVKHTLMALTIAGSCAHAPISAFSIEYLKSKVEDLKFGKRCAGIIHSGISACSAFAAIATLVKTPAITATATSLTPDVITAAQTAEAVDTAANSGVGVLTVLALYSLWRAWANFSELHKLDEIEYILEELEGCENGYGYDYYATSYPECVAQIVLNYPVLIDHVNVIAENVVSANDDDQYDAYENLYGDAAYDNEDDASYETNGTLYYVENV
jgi:hypothetical protein